MHRRCFSEPEATLSAYVGLGWRIFGHLGACEDEEAVTPWGSESLDSVSEGERGWFSERTWERSVSL